MMLASLTKIESIALDDGEAESLATAVKGVLDLYDVPEIAPAAIAWINLAQTCGVIYGTRIIAARRSRPPRQQQQRPATPPPNGAGGGVIHTIGGLELEVPAMPGQRPPEGPRQ
jgi:hypothetical protein